MFLALATMFIISSCELINAPVEDVIIEVVNKEGTSLQNVSIAVRMSGDVSDMNFTFENIDPNSSRSDQVEVMEKFIHVYEVELTSLDVTLQDSDFQDIPISIDADDPEAEPVMLVDPVGTIEYHGFRALVKQDLKIVIEIGWSWDDTGDPILSADSDSPSYPFQMWIGYTLAE